MQFRQMKKSGDEITLFGLGTMRMPLNKEKQLNENAAIKMIRKAIDSGVNYVDTAYMYHDFLAEKVVGKSLKDGYREKVFLANKMPVWLAKNEKEMEELFNKQLENCQTAYFDFYLLHNVTKGNWKIAQDYNCLEFLTKMKEEGKIKHLGFSFHDDYDFFTKVIDSYNWDFCQIQLNYMDIEFQAGVKGYEYATSKDIPVIIMEPLKGGKLVDNVPSSVISIWENAPVKRSPVDWGLRWVANFENVLTVLCGVHSEKQLEENIEILSTALPNSLTKEDLATIEKASNEYNNLIPYSCTECNYCLPCPQKINIPSLISSRNEWELYDHSPKVASDYILWNHPKRLAGACISCDICVSKCPQGLNIPAILNETKEIFGK